MEELRTIVRIDNNKRLKKQCSLNVLFILLYVKLKINIYILDIRVFTRFFLKSKTTIMK